MKKMVGYIFSFAGLAVMALGFGTFKLDWAVLNVIKPGIITGIGVAAIAIGVFILVRSPGGKGKTKHATPEVPIYRGDKIVGYRRE